MTPCTLVAGGTAAQRLAAIAAHLDASQATAVIAEGAQQGAGLPGAVPLADAGSADALLRVAVIAPGCPHCDAGLVMRVTLDRILRHPPAALFISLADPTHLPHLQEFLAIPPYAAHLALTPAVRID